MQAVFGVNMVWYSVVYMVFIPIYTAYYTFSQRSCVHLMNHDYVRFFICFFFRWKCMCVWSLFSFIIKSLLSLFLFRSLCLWYFFACKQYFANYIYIYVWNCWLQWYNKSKYIYEYCYDIIEPALSSYFAFIFYFSLYAMHDEMLMLYVRVL